MSEKIKSHEYKPNADNVSPAAESKRQASISEVIRHKAGKVSLGTEIELNLAYSGSIRDAGNSKAIEALRDPQATQAYTEAEAMDRLVLDESGEPLSQMEAQANYSGNGVTSNPDGTHTLRYDGTAFQVDSQGSSVEQPPR